VVHTVRVGPRVWRRCAPAMVLAVAACGESGSGPTLPVATRLGITVQPSNATAGAAIAPGMQVVIVSSAGTTVTTATTAVTVVIDSNSLGATLLGTATVNAVNGVATFANLSITRAGTGYRLVASASGLTRATSAPFAITAGAASQLAFVIQPRATLSGGAISPAVQVAVQDAFGNTVTAATHSVTAAIRNNPGGGMLSGTTAASAANGVATFSDLSIDKPGTGYTLAVSADGLFDATSTAFDIIAPLSFTTVAAGGAGRGSHTCAVTTDGTIYCWGFNGNGQLGDGTRTNRAVPALVQAPAGVTFQAVSAGGQHTCAVASTGDAYCWGRNEFGRLGDGTAVDRTLPVRVAAPAGVTFTSVGTGAGFSCGLAAAGGSVYCWGSKFAGELGDHSGVDQLSPVLVQAPGGVTFAALATGLDHSCGLATSGAVYCWGYNAFGQLGDNTTVDKPTPVQAGAPAAVTFATVEAGYAHTCAVTSAGAAYCWGGNGNAQLGDNTTVDKLVPTAVQGGVVFAVVSGGGDHTCGVSTSGIGYCWGANGSGQIGDNTTLAKLAPAVTAGSLSLSVAAAGLNHSCAVAAGASASVYCWGANDHGELGDGTTVPRLVPTRVLR